MERLFAGRLPEGLKIMIMRFEEQQTSPVKELLRSYRIEPLRAENFNDLVKLYNLIHPADKDMQRFSRKFDTAVFGSSPIGHLAYSTDNSIAAYYGIFPITLQHKGKAVKGAQSGETMTHPEHRNRGLFAHLAQLTIQSAKQAGIQFIFGIPNNNSKRGLEKAGWRQQGTMIEYRMTCSPSLKARAIRKLSLSYFSGYLERLVSSRRMDRVPEQFKQERAAFSVMHSIDFFRSKVHPSNHFLEFTDAFAFVKIEQYSIKLGDYRMKKGGDETRFWNELRKLGDGAGAYSVVFQLSPGLEKEYSIPRPVKRSEAQPIMIISPGETTVSAFELTAMDYDTF